MFLVVGGGGGGRARDHDELNSNFGLKIMFSCYFWDKQHPSNSLYWRGYSGYVVNI